jgi:hypothetical protein
MSRSRFVGGEFCGRAVQTDVHLVLSLRNLRDY